MLALLLLCSAFAGQTSFTTQAGPREQSFEIAWKDAAGQAQRVAFALPAGAVARDLSLPVRLPLKKAAEAQAEGVRAYAAGVKGPTVKVATRTDGSVRISATGRDSGRVREALEGAEAARDAALDRFLDQQRWVRDDKGRLRPDHARVASEYAASVRPVAEALGMVGADPRDGLARALGFVQSIKYERKKKSGKDAGFRRPLATLAANTADCDGKSALFLALARAAYPDLPLAMVYIPEHAFVGVGVEPGKGERTFKHDKVRYVLAEPVGPAMAPLGEGAKPSQRRAAWGAIEVVPVP